MAIVVGENSYVTLAEADEYFGNRLDVDAWTSATELLKSQSLTTAAMLLDNMQWLGTAVDASQLMAFPRRVTYRDPRLNLYVTPEITEVPRRIKTANYELAYHLLNNDGLLDSTGSVNDLTVGDIDLKRIYNAPLLPPIVAQLIAPLQVSPAESRRVYRGN